MAALVVPVFVKFLHSHGYTTRMWEHGISIDAANEVCHEMSVWVRREFSLPGEFIILWTEWDGIYFGGDAELAYSEHGQAWLLPNPFLEGDMEGFSVGLQHLVNGQTDAMFAVPVRNRVLYNAV